MKFSKRKQLIESHGISCMISNSRLLAEEVSVYKGTVGSEWIDVTGWTNSRLAEWLGY